MAITVNSNGLANTLNWKTNVSANFDNYGVILNIVNSTSCPQFYYLVSVNPQLLPARAYVTQG